MKKLAILTLLLALVACGGESEVVSKNCTDCQTQVGATGATGATGSSGQDGTQGVAGLNSLIDFERVALDPSMCESQSGMLIYTGLDKDLDLLLAVDERSKTSFLCDGKVGGQGTSGTSCSVASVVGGSKITCGSSSSYVYNGANGINGTNGTNGTNGANGSSCSVSNTTSGAVITCTNGTSQQIYDGATGPQGPAGINGTNATTNYNVYDIFFGTSSNPLTNTGSCVNIGDGLSARYYGIHTDGNRVTKVFKNSTCDFNNSGLICTLHPNGFESGTGGDGDEVCFYNRNQLVIDSLISEGDCNYRLHRIKF